MTKINAIGAISMSAICVALAAGTLAAKPTTLTGTYVEARTAEVFAGGCIINSEAGTTGREALLAWNVEHGRFDGVRLDGLSVVAAVSADANLGIHEIGGEVAHARAALFPDARATAAQRKALIAMAKTLSNGIVSNVVEVSPAAIEFVAGAQDIRVATQTVRLTVQKELNHEASCGNKQWFHPLASVHHADLGTAAENAFTGASLGTKWSDPNKRSAFFGTFAY
jgi:hypothetical protein